MLKDIKVGDKVVYECHEKIAFILIEKIESLEFEIPQEDGSSKPSGEFTTVINDKYIINGPLRKAKESEVEKETFIGMIK